VLQFLSYMAAKTTRAKLGSMVVVLPWHDPVRIAEQISLLDHLSGGRVLLGLGRGLARVEYEGFRIDQNEGRQRFLEYAEVVLTALEQGYIEGGETLKQPRCDIRPHPLRSFRRRTYAAAVSPESMPIMAQLGLGLLIIPQKPWDVVEKDFAVYHQVYREVNGTEAPPPLCAAFCFVDEHADRAEEMAYKYIGGYYHTAMRHYEMTADLFGTSKSYEFYRKVGQYIGRHGQDSAARDFARLMPWGTPAQVIDKLATIRTMIGMNGLICHFSYAGMPYEEAERNMQCFVAHVLPELKTWETPPLFEPTLLATPVAGS
jgi:alkanesulfonate monooxygenase SsuD/methylene tetrahydromethanopterin reductase-like flavin-dependent oxidoreductase (luciferase family)